ncbi:hypothetical protein A3Q56_04126 [Intoshia linei]|uniref:NADH dehydrogenase [ubiquinone] flavoprotein 2, mitochondrial n=1 Tax=Intoshia linei TaxID=1819745 RepID=A0A177B314_9BILA|nr:hypothetical protein A3Q56_04126 [Intoshia linei]
MVVSKILNRNFFKINTIRILRSKFSFTSVNEKYANAIIGNYPNGYQKAALLPLLDLAQRQNGWVSVDVMHYVANFLSISRMSVYEVATFYTMFNRKPMGKYHVQICTCSPCMLGGIGSDRIVDAVKNHLKINFGETTKDDTFTLNECECLGACVNAPMVQINDDYYEDLDETSIVKILSDLGQGKKTKPGPQSQRKTCEPLKGPTSLISEIKVISEQFDFVSDKTK